MRTTWFAGLLWSSLCVAALLTGGCRDVPPPSTESAAAVAVARTPALVHLANRPPQRVFRYGDVLTLDPPVRSFTWGSVLEDGELAQRTGETMLATRAPAEGSLHVFLGDLQRGVQVPTASWICERLGRGAADPSACELTLRRMQVLPRRTLAYLPGEGEGRPLALIQDADVSMVVLGGLHDVRVETVSGKTVALVERWWGSAHAAEVVVYGLEGALQRLGALPTLQREVLGDDTVLEWRTAVRVVAGELRVVGTRHTELKGQGMQSAPVRETYGVTPEGRLVRTGP